MTQTTKQLHKLKELADLVLNADYLFFNHLETRVFQDGELDHLILRVNELHDQWQNNQNTESLTRLSNILTWLSTYSGQEKYYELLPSIVGNQNNFEQMEDLDFYYCPESLKRHHKDYLNKGIVKKTFDHPTYMRALHIFAKHFGVEEFDDVSLYDYIISLNFFENEHEKGVLIDDFITDLEKAIKKGNFKTHISPMQREKDLKDKKNNISYAFSEYAIAIGIPEGETLDLADQITHYSGDIEKLKQVLDSYKSLSDKLGVIYNSEIHEKLKDIVHFGSHQDKFIETSNFLIKNYKKGMLGELVFSNMLEFSNNTGHREYFEKMFKGYRLVFSKSEELANKLYEISKDIFDEEISKGMIKIASDERALREFMNFLDEYKPSKNELTHESSMYTKLGTLTELGYEWTPKRFRAAFSDTHKHRFLAPTLESLGKFISHKAENYF